MPRNKGGDNSVYKTIGIDKLKVDPECIRKIRSDISGLKRTIADVGLLQPILAREVNGDYIVIDGTRRLRALKELEVPELILGRDVIVDALETEADTKFKQIIANIQREDINDIELGRAFVTLKETYGYQYIEIAEIIGKTQHYVSSKVGMAKRLDPEVQELIVNDWEAAKCIQNNLTDASPYVMNVNIIEDIARLPAREQKPAYEAIKAKEMDKTEALQFLRFIKQRKGIEEQKGHEVAAVVCGKQEHAHGEDINRCLKKIDREVESLTNAIKVGAIDVSQAENAIVSLIERLNRLYVEIKNDKLGDASLILAE